ncbi:phage gp6-like head-tail connector protein [Streptomyces sp. ICN441]|uniref:head-tail connector protein n=1 Tax=Streptomyces sp. ICN441 TaxID=2558286 RepID=UPI00106BD02C|nr:head-tail connector protein [Streptomyces sp. ICN441]TFE42498.1 phage gp6-like head-tail connector protein [Streptomyces sp. ICN441]
MAETYGTTATLKARLGIEVDDTSRDALLGSALEAASRGIERATGRRFWLDGNPSVRTYRPKGRVVRQSDGELLLVDDIGSLASGIVVESGSGASFTAVTDYEMHPENALADGMPVTGLLRVNGYWGSDTSRVRVTTRFGWPAVPGDITEAALIQAGRLFRRKDSPEGVLGSAEWGVTKLARRDPDVAALIEPFIIPGFA